MATYDKNKILRQIFFILLLIFVVGYAYIKADKIITGPKIIINSPKDGETVNEGLVTINGKAENINIIELNDNPIRIDDNGNFSEKLLLSAGYNIIKLEAKDKFGKATEKLLKIVYLSPGGGSAEETATSTEN